jgi:tetratricopeptide (TPR) repeat protein
VWYKVWGQVNYEKAIGAFSSCIQMDSSNARAFLCRGISYECINNMDAAVADYTKAIALLPEDGKAYYMRGMLLWRLCDEMAINDLEKSAELHYKPARDFLSKKTSQSTKSPQKNIERSLQEEAIRIFTESIRYDPSNAGTYLNRGMAYERINNMHQAIADYSKAIELAPDFAKAYYVRGTLLWYLDDDTSIRDLRKAAELGYGLAKDFLDQNTTREQC